MKRFDFIEHTADVAVRVYGASLKELFTSAAIAMYSILVAKKGNRRGAPLKEITVNKTEEALEDLLKSWLDELLFYYSSERLILHRIKTLEISEFTLSAKVLLETVDENYFDIKEEIKAVTYHELKVENVRNKWRAHIIFDV